MTEIVERVTSVGMSEKIVTPKDAAAMILLRNPNDPEVFWVKRSLQLAFMGGFQAFPGGQRDADDDNVAVLNCEDKDDAAMRVCAVREVFEEAGVLIARGVEKFTKAKITQLRDEHLAEKIPFSELIARERLQIDALMLEEAPRWVTPPPAPKRFNTYFFVAWLPDCADGVQEASIIPGELENGEWNRPQAAVDKWRNGEILIAPPVFFPIIEMLDGLDGFVPRLYQHHQAALERKHGIEFRYGFKLVSLRTPTIPPATHTNCYLVGGEEFVIIDPGSPYPEEQEKLDAVLDNLLAEGRRIREIIITHLHPDHIGGVMHLAEKYQVPVAAHALTADAITDSVKVARFIADDEIIELAGGKFAPDLTWRLRALWSPGHARGHLSFYEERTGSLLTGDCIVGFGTVVIAPPEGNMLDYLNSLQRYLCLPKLTALLPAHGPVLANAEGKIQEYIQHRYEREAKILAAMGSDTVTIPEIVVRVYTDVSPALHPLAAMSVKAHLEKLIAENTVKQMGEQFVMV